MKPFACPSPSESLAGTRRAVTLVELLVAMGVGAVVLAILFNTFHQTQRLAIREITRNRQRQEAQILTHRISAILAGAVPLAALDLPSQPPEIFEPDRLRIVSWQGATADALWIHEVHAAAASDETQFVPIEITRLTLDGTPAPEQRRTTDLPFRAEFEYLPVGNAGPAAWQPSLGEGEFPSHVRITLTSRLGEDQVRPVVLSTVVATGARVLR
ncbi:prepilin-type N-terminal cleavage/methylation domain-containing protein [Candidatus Sumerlaeota bacterium]|nr:prepilin-type N-terminal cleavage/methylation domain-containing protein [Candidatus Sumerlaeota bacterium]